MSAEASSSRFDNVKWILILILVGAGVYGNSYFADQSLLYRVLGLLALGMVAAMIALQTSQGAAFWTLTKESRTEIRKVVWPTRQETLQTTMIVVAFVLVVALILWGLDSLLRRSSYLHWHLCRWCNDYGIGLVIWIPWYTIYLIDERPIKSSGFLSSPNGSGLHETGWCCYYVLIICYCFA